MKKESKIKKVIILGSGGLQIGQAGEFDYSGSQAIKALKEEGITTVLINPNIATVQTDTSMADRIYFLPLNIESVTKIIQKERPDAILLSFGGQTALNLGLKLDEEGILKTYDVKILGTPITSIRVTEDRELFKAELKKINVHTARSIAVYNTKEAVLAAQKIGYPIMMRSGYSLGGLGSGRINSKSELLIKVREIFAVVSQILIEEYLVGWKEIEYEVVRDVDGNTITVCNMENMDPMGVHTGESIVVAPSQTLTNKQYHQLRSVAIKTINHLAIIGECNIQYAVNPLNDEYRVIEVNARLSRSSALASKATGYPLAFVATKLILGKKLHELKNSITGSTSAFFEPALDYIAVKIPRWDLTKFKFSDAGIGSEMKSIGEVMALGRTFPETLQKAVRMLNIGANGLSFHPYTFDDPMEEVSYPTFRRLYAIYEAFKKGHSVAQIQASSHINEWFLEQMASIYRTEKELTKLPLTRDTLLNAKKQGFSDNAIANLTKTTEAKIRSKRQKDGIVPSIKLIDTLAGEFDAVTNYLYTTYNGASNDVYPLKTNKSIIVIGSGPYCIGSSVEFDWSAVNTVQTLRNRKLKTIIINSNPETVSTDFDRSDRLYFEELSFERIQDIAEYEQPKGIILASGGQIAQNLALPLELANYPILGTTASNIDRAEDRNKFSSMLHTLNIDQPMWSEVTDEKSALQFARDVGYPILIRPSYVLSGGAMNVVRSDADLKLLLTEAALVSQEHPVVVSQFISGAKELEIDGVAKDGKLIIYAISEHIENAGVHSGDATVVYPAQYLYIETIRRAKLIAKQITKSLEITGPFNIQYLAKNNELKVIECNVRASRSLPFVSKVSGHNFIEIATDAMLGIRNDQAYQTLELEYVAVKTSRFSYSRLKGADPVAGVEMASTGEVACFGKDLKEAFYLSWLATEQEIKGKKIFISVPDEAKHKFLLAADILTKQGWKIYSTQGTHAFFVRNRIRSTHLYKINEHQEPSVASAILKHKFDVMVCVPAILESNRDAYTIRRLAIDHHIPLFTNAETGSLMLQCLTDQNQLAIEPKAWQDYVSV